MRMVPGGISFLSEPEEPKATIRSTPAIAMAARLARKLIRCGGRPCWWRISITISPERRSALPNGVATLSFLSSGIVEKSRLVPPMIPSIRCFPLNLCRKSFACTRAGPWVFEERLGAPALIPSERRDKPSRPLNVKTSLPHYLLMGMFDTVSDETIKRGECTDIYFIRTEEVLAREKINPLVTMEVTAAALPDSWGIACGLSDVLALLSGVPVTVDAMPEGTLFYPGEPVLRITGHY